MAKKAPDVPPAPDPFEVASAQQGLNVNTALAQSALNQYEEITPYGSTRYEPTGDVRTFGGSGEMTGMGAPGGGGGIGFPTNASDFKRAMLGGLGGFGGFGGDGGGGQGFDSFSIPTMRRITEFSPEQQRIFEAEMDTTGDLYDLANQYVGRVSDNLQNPFSYEGMPAAPTADADARQQTIDALYGQFTSRMDPQFEQDRQALQQRLANQGINIGSDAYNQEMDRYGRTRNDAYTSALNQAIVGGGAEQSRLFGLQASERERAIQEADYLRNQPINEITALMSGRGLTMPQFSPTPQTAVNAADYSGAAYNSYAGQLKAADIAAQSRNALVGALGGLGGSVLGAAGSAGGFGKLFSDERLKENIHDTGIAVDGVPIKTWEWKGSGETDIGVIAQDVERKKPGAVVKDDPSGYRKVDYGRVFGLEGA